MKIRSTFVFLAALLVVANCVDYFRGYPVISTNSSDPTCYLTLRDATTSAGIQFNASSFMVPVNYTCPFPNIHFANIFHQDINLSPMVSFTNTSTNNLWTGTLDAMTVANLNSTACVYLPQTDFPYDKYLCYIQYSTISYYLEVYGTGNASNFQIAIDVNNDNLQLPNYANFHSLGLAYNDVEVNHTFPKIIATIVDSNCNAGSANNSIGYNSTVMISSSVNLTAYLPGMMIRYVVFRIRSGVPTDSYAAVSPSNVTVFDSQGNASCYTLPFKYSDLLPRADYCGSLGCDVIFIMSNWQGPFGSGDIFVLPTVNGAFVGTSSNNSSSSKGSSGNSNSGNSTSGNNNTNCTGSGNGNSGSISVTKSAASITINIVLIVAALTALVFH